MVVWSTILLFIKYLTQADNMQGHFTQHVYTTNKLGKFLYDYSILRLIFGKTHPCLLSQLF